MLDPVGGQRKCYHRPMFRFDFGQQLISNLKLKSSFTPIAPYASIIRDHVEFIRSVIIRVSSYLHFRITYLIVNYELYFITSYNSEIKRNRVRYGSSRINHLSSFIEFDGCAGTLSNKHMYLSPDKVLFYLKIEGKIGSENDHKKAFWRRR